MKIHFKHPSVLLLFFIFDEVPVFSRNHKSTLVVVILLHNINDAYSNKSLNQIYYVFAKSLFRPRKSTTVNYLFILFDDYFENNHTRFILLFHTRFILLFNTRVSVKINIFSLKCDMI